MAGWRNLPLAVEDGKQRRTLANDDVLNGRSNVIIKGLGAVRHEPCSGTDEALNLHHGTLNAVFLPEVLRFNAPQCGEKYERIRQTIGLAPGADLSEAISVMNADIGLPLACRQWASWMKIFQT